MQTKKHDTKHLLKFSSKRGREDPSTLSRPITQTVSLDFFSRKRFNKKENEGGGNAYSSSATSAAELVNDRYVVQKIPTVEANGSWNCIGINLKFMI